MHKYLVCPALCRYGHIVSTMVIHHNGVQADAAAAALTVEVPVTWWIAADGTASEPERREEVKRLSWTDSLFLCMADRCKERGIWCPWRDSNARPAA